MTTKINLEFSSLSSLSSLNSLNSRNSLNPSTRNRRINRAKTTAFRCNVVAFARESNIPSFNKAKEIYQKKYFFCFS